MRLTGLRTIYKMEMWDEAYMNMETQAYIRFHEDGSQCRRVSTDRTIIRCEEAEPFMPAYQRASPSQFAEINLPAARHEFEVIAERKEEPLQVMVLPVSTGRTKQSGPFYYYTEILFFC